MPRSLGQVRSVPWEQVREVVVPPEGDRRHCVQLVLRGGEVIPITPLAQLQNSKTHADRATPGYLRSGEALISAHRAWLARSGTSR